MGVTAAVIVQEGSVLITRRGPGGSLAGMWEFPGGKQEEGEDPKACLARGLMEELAIHASIGDLFADTTYEYGSGRLHLMAFDATITSGTHDLTVHGELAWVDPRSLELFDPLPADVPIARNLADQYAL